ncbi:hypothetical protein H0E87_002022 [Populus deltoides]|uniref:Aminotransferase-like plant mobile domain-containing protein n=1 Tax=Populus deltoides TaxID=3696 RepID=A0A8T2ZTN5_POPDE|nr:hypothetical protein H0E87_002022 [Populus deltoides]
MDVATPNITFDEEDSQIQISGHSLRNDPGPFDPSVLYDQDEHISSAVWEGLERGALRCHEHTSKLEEWKLTGKQLELCWSYWHLNIGRPKLNQGQAHDTFPLALRWKQKLSGLRSKCDVVQYRKALDSLQPCDVEWQPYHDMDEIVPEDIKDTLILGRSRTTLICLDKAEKHLPDRCVRQFGFNQPIPQEVPQWKGIDGEADQSKSIASSCEDWSKHRDQIVEGDDRVDDSEYLLWYSNITRKFVGRHTSLESMFRQTVAGMTKMLELAKTLSRDDMFLVNQKAVENIKNILSESLKNPFSNSKGKLPTKGSKKRKLIDI